MKTYFIWLPILATIVIDLQCSFGLTVRDVDQAPDNNNGTLFNTRVNTTEDPTKRAFIMRDEIRKRVDEPSSPIHLFNPDRIYYYTKNSNGEMTIKEMTKNDIHSLKATGTANWYTIDDPPKTNHQPEGTKVLDVITSVKKVVGTELSKPLPTKTVVPTIPDAVHDEWNAKFPTILTSESNSNQATFMQEPAIIKYPDPPIPLPEESEEKIMIPVQTVEKPSHYDTEEDTYEKINTIPAEKATATGVNLSVVNQDNKPDAFHIIKPISITPPDSRPESFDNDKIYSDALHTAASLENISKEENRNDTISVIAESSSTSVKVSGKDEVKIHHEEVFNPQPIINSTETLNDLLIIGSTEITVIETKIEVTEYSVPDDNTERSTESMILLENIELSEPDSDTTFNKTESGDKSNNSGIGSIKIENDMNIRVTSSNLVNDNYQVSTEQSNVNNESTLSSMNFYTFMDISSGNTSSSPISEKSGEENKNTGISNSSSPSIEKVVTQFETDTDKSPLNPMPIKVESPSKSELISNDLTDSISSMINQVSDQLPSVIPTIEDQKSKVPQPDGPQSEPVNSEIESKESEDTNEFTVPEAVTTEVALSTTPIDSQFEAQTMNSQDSNAEEAITDIIYSSEPIPLITIPDPEISKVKDEDSEVNSSTEFSSETPITNFSGITEAPHAETTMEFETSNSEEMISTIGSLAESSSTPSNIQNVNNEESKSDNQTINTDVMTESTPEKNFYVENDKSGHKNTEDVSNVDESISTSPEPAITDFEKYSENNSAMTFEIKTPNIPQKDSEITTSNESTTLKEGFNEEKKKVEIIQNFTESPIVRINVTEPKEDDIKDSDPENKEAVEDITESTMVRIKLTNPLSTIHTMIETAIQESTPEYENLKLPLGNVSANGIGSGLIAGFDSEPNVNGNTSVDMTNSMQTIHFDQLPMAHNLVELGNSTSSTATTEATIKIISVTPSEIGSNKTLSSEKINKINESSINSEKNLTLNAIPSETPTISDNSSLLMSTTESLSEVVKTLSPLSKNGTNIEPLFSNPENNSKSETKMQINNTAAGMTEIPSLTTEMSKLEAEINNGVEAQNRLKDQKKETSMEIMEKVSTLAPPETIKKTETPITTERTQAPRINTTPKPIAAEPTNWIPVPQPDDLASKVGNTPIISKTPEEPDSHSPVALNHSKTTPGLDTSIQNLDQHISYFSNHCNNLAFKFWNAINEGLSTSRSLALSPFGMTSMLTMIFFGARGTTSKQMNDLLKLDDFDTFNPHLVFQNVSDSISLVRNQGVANAVFVRELLADKVKVQKLQPFYKEQAQKYYDGIVAEVNFAFVSDVIRRRTNLMVRRQTGGRIRDFVKSNLLPLRSPLAALSANVFQTDCSSGDATSEGRDGELYFAVSSLIRQRKLIPVPATLWKTGVLAGYEPNLDATAIALGGLDKIVSTIFVVPGQPGAIAPGDNLDKLEHRFVDGALHDGAWGKLLKVIIPRPGLELQVPKFSHRSIINATAALKSMGLQELFSKDADLKGMNLIGHHLADAFQMNLFSTCGDENVLTGKHHEEVYPASSQRNARISENEWNENDDQNSRISKFSRQVEDDKPRLKLDRPFLYFVRHNPTGLILHMGRFNPRLLP